MEAVASWNAKFALDLYAKVAAEPGNVFVSPYSISSALGMTWAGARGETADKMAGVLHYQPGNPDAVHAGVGALMRELEARGNDKGLRLRIANRLYGGVGEKFLPEFLDLIEKNYAGGLERVNFAGDPEGARKTINAWVEKKTEDKIKDLLVEGNITPVKASLSFVPSCGAQRP